MKRGKRVKCVVTNGNEAWMVRMQNTDANCNAAHLKITYLIRYLKKIKDV